MNETQKTGRQYFYEITQSKDSKAVRTLQSAIRASALDDVNVLSQNFIKNLPLDQQQKDCVKAWLDYKISRGGKESLKKVFKKILEGQFKSAGLKTERANEKEYLKSPQYTIDMLSKRYSEVSENLKENKKLARNCLEVVFTTNLLNGKLDNVIEKLNAVVVSSTKKDNAIRDILTIKALMSEDKLTEDAVEFCLKIDMGNLIEVLQPLDSLKEDIDYEQLGTITDAWNKNSSIKDALDKNDNTTTLSYLLKKIKEQRDEQRDLWQALKDLDVKMEDDKKSAKLIRLEKEVEKELNKWSLANQSARSPETEENPVVRQSLDNQTRVHQPQQNLEEGAQNLYEDADLAAAIAASLNDNIDLDMQQAMVESINDQEIEDLDVEVSLSRESTVNSSSSVSAEEQIAEDIFANNKPNDSSANSQEVPKARRSFWSIMLTSLIWISKPFVWFINLFRTNKI